MRILLAGTFAGVAGQGGATWAVLQYALGLRQLGHDVVLVEPAPEVPDVTAYFSRVVAGFDLAGRAALLHGGRRTSGIAWGDLAAWVAGADVLINLAGVLDTPELTAGIPLRVYVDLDPAFTQLWQAVEGIDMHLGGHNRFVTVGQAVGTGASPVPTCGVDWLPTVPPVVLERWPEVTVAPSYGLTTVGNWRSYGSVTHNGVHHGQKVHAVRALLELPRRVQPVAVEPSFAVDPGEPVDLAALASHGWRLVAPGVAAGDPWRYQAFVGASTAEIGVAKTGYVVSRCAWFSDRSACYLASGRPVIAQDTGWPAYLPHGAGLLAFTDLDGAADAVAEVLGHLDRHRAAAREVAAECFDSRRVLTRLLQAVGAA